MVSEERLTLDNGFHIRYRTTEDPLVRTKLIVHAGTVNEQAGQEGIAHFLEHCLAIGGARGYEPTTSHAMLRGSGRRNWSTSLEETTVHATLLPRRLHEWTMYALTHAFEPHFNPTRVEMERTAVLNEITDYQGNISFGRRQIANEAFFRGHIKSKDSLGTSDVIAKTTIDDLRAFHATHYTPSNMTLLLAGPIEQGLIRDITSYVERFPAGVPTRIRAFPPLLPIERAQTLRFAAPELRNGEQMSGVVTTACITVPEGHPDEPAIDTLSTVLKDYTRLDRALRTERGLVYGVSVYNNGNTGGGELIINAQMQPHHFEEAIDAIFLEFCNLQKEPVSRELLEQLNEQYEFKTATRNVGADGHVAMMCFELNAGYPLEQYYEQLRAVTPEQIMDVAQKYLPRTWEERHITSIWDPLMRA